MYKKLKIYTLIAATFMSLNSFAIDLDSPAVQTQIDCVSYNFQGEVFSEKLDGNNLLIQDLPIGKSALMTVAKIKDEKSDGHHIEVIIKAPVNNNYETIMSFIPVISNSYHNAECDAKTDSNEQNICDDAQEKNHIVNMHAFSVISDGATTTCTIYIQRN